MKLAAVMMLYDFGFWIAEILLDMKSIFLLELLFKLVLIANDLSVNMAIDNLGSGQCPPYL